jgi:hypothetical protein
MLIPFSAKTNRWAIVHRVLRGGSSSKSDHSIYQNITLLGGFGGIPPLKIFKVWSLEMWFPAFWASNSVIKFGFIRPYFRQKVTKSTQEQTEKIRTTYLVVHWMLQHHRKITYYLHTVQYGHISGPWTKGCTRVMFCCILGAWYQCKEL